jgi:hypothetical protein
MNLRQLISITKRLSHAFPQSYINNNLEFIAHERANEYFILADCETDLDIKCKVLEWLSRGAHKTCPFNSDLKNKRFNNFMLNGINIFLGTDFTEDDIEIIYDNLGNCCNHKLTIEFINSGYNMELLTDRGERE